MIELRAEYRAIRSKTDTSEDDGSLARVELQFVVGDTDRGLAVNEFE